MKIRTERLIIRPFANLEEYLEYIDELPLDQYSKLLNKGVATKNSKRGFYNLPPTPFVEYLILDFDNNKLGTTTLSYNPDYYNAELARSLKTSAQGKGYGLEALIALREHIIKPLIGQKVNFVPNLMTSKLVGSFNSKSNLTSQTDQDLVVQISDKPFKGAYAFASIQDFPSLSGNLLAKATIVSVKPSGCVIVAFADENMRDEVDRIQLLALSQACMNRQAYEDAKSAMVELIKAATKTNPYTLLSLLQNYVNIIRDGKQGDYVDEIFGALNELNLGLDVLTKAGDARAAVIHNDFMIGDDKYKQLDSRFDQLDKAIKERIEATIDADSIYTERREPKIKVALPIAGDSDDNVSDHDG